METKEQILNKIKELQAIVDKMPDEPKGLWKPKTGDEVYFIPQYINKVSLGLYARTEKQIKEKIEALQVHQQLKEIAHELNNGVEIDWSNYNQNKYSLSYAHNKNMIEYFTSWSQQSPGIVYCLSAGFIGVALERIGKEKLERYLKEGF